MRVALASIFLLSIALCASAQTSAPPSRPATHTGCVTALPDDPKSLVLSEPTGCSVLSGKHVTKRLAGHIVVLKGTLLEATSSDPQTIMLDEVATVGAACHETCTLEPPGHRGLHSRPKPGTQGGTPGLHDSDPPSSTR